ncbi:TPA: LPS export ABC transporter ATP-binding protein [Candidatus Galligastranaerophilus intestinavium]|uniref:LPS export ABC transporter ATP-binding protein n=1 Tax=Candidatus Galligastranaerophilus intestinavium TaxID=2840836 RepID=A0A9D1FIV7_9BACT|nr:LPS export ABC transporter ATP-binding protein [Candidatus Galligastranaerophilus intestinavium]
MRIIANNLIKIYGDRSVVNDVSFEVNKGEVVGLLGPNGAGKTTTFYMIVGLVKANSGHIFLQNKKNKSQIEITQMPMNERAKKGIGYLPQEASIFRKLSVEDNLKLVLEMNDSLNQEQKAQKLEDLLEEFGVKKLRTASAVSLSGGERRRVEIARALAATPHFILLDEPFTGIDPIAIGEIKENIYKLAREKGIGVLITDHNPKATLSITDRAYVIFDGKIKISGKSQDVAVDPVAKEFYLGKDFTL